MTRLSKDEGSTLYVPLKFDLKAIDALSVRVDTLLMLCQSKSWRRSSIQTSSPDWEKWTVGLVGFEIVVSFLWIHEGERIRNTVEADVAKLALIRS
jgi:hypothetical protein